MIRRPANEGGGLTAIFVADSTGGACVAAPEGLLRRPGIGVGHQDAIHAAGWVSLFTLHALWPFLWIWAMAYRPERGWGFSHSPSETNIVPGVNPGELDELRRRVAELESRLKVGTE